MATSTLILKRPITQVKVDLEENNLKVLGYVKRDKGHWISDRLITTTGGTYGVRRCSECEAYYQDVGYGWNFCPNCGSSMREDDEEC